VTKNGCYMALPYADNITIAAEKNSLKGSDVKLGLRNLNCLNRFIKVHKDRVSREQYSGVINWTVKNAMSHMWEKLRDNSL